MRVLVVDDSKTVRYVVTKLLHELGYQNVVEAAEVMQAKRAIKTGKPDLILSDMNMPGESGLDLLTWVRGNAETAKIPFIILTTEHERKVVFQAVKAGVQYYLYKPIEQGTLIEKLQALSGTHGIQPPQTGKQRVSPAPKAEEIPAGNEDAVGKVTQERIDDIIEHFTLVWDGELAMRDFREWLGREALGLGEDCLDVDAVTDLVGKLKSVAIAAISTRLKQLWPGNPSAGA